MITHTNKRIAALHFGEYIIFLIQLLAISFAFGCWTLIYYYGPRMRRFALFAGIFCLLIGALELSASFTGSHTGESAIGGAISFFLGYLLLITATLFFWRKEDKHFSNWLENDD